MLNLRRPISHTESSSDASKVVISTSKTKSFLGNSKFLKMRTWRHQNSCQTQNLWGASQQTSNLDLFGSKETTCCTIWSQERSKDDYSPLKCFLKCTKGREFCSGSWLEMKSGYIYYNSSKENYTRPSLVSPFHHCAQRHQRKTSTIQRPCSVYGGVGIMCC